MEDLLTDLFRPVFRALLALCRGLFWLAWHGIIEVIFWGVGWCVLRLLSLGHYPEEGILEAERAGLAKEIAISLFGFFVLSSSIYGLSVLLGA